MLTLLDWIIIGVYFAILLVIGYLAGKNETTEGFLIGDRKVDSFAATATIGSSVVGAGILLAYTSLAILYGAGAIWLFLGNIVGFVLFYFFAVYIKPMADKHNFYTLPDYFYHKYGNRAGKISAILVVLITIGWIVVNFIGGGKTISTFTNISFEWSTILVGLIIAVYLMLGGFKAVVRTDALQFFGIWSLLLLMAFMLMKYSVQLSWSDFNIMRLPIEDIIALFVAGAITPISSPELWQRIYAVKDKKTLRTSVIGVSIFMIMMGVALLLISLIIRKQIPTIDPSVALPEGFAALLPQGWAGLAVVVFYSAIMSSADTYLFTANASLTQDVLYRDKTNELKVRRSKRIVFFVAAFAVLLAILVQDVVDAAYVLMAIMIVLGIIVLISWRRNLQSNAVVYALIGGFLAVIVGLLVSGITTTLLGYSLVGLILGLIANSLFNSKK